MGPEGLGLGLSFEQGLSTYLSVHPSVHPPPPPLIHLSITQLDLFMSQLKPLSVASWG